MTLISKETLLDGYVLEIHRGKVVMGSIIIPAAEGSEVAVAISVKHIFLCGASASRSNITKAFSAFQSELGMVKIMEGMTDQQLSMYTPNPINTKGEPH